MPDDLEDLPGVGPATADKLLDNGYNDYKAIAVASAGELSNEADIGESSANDIIQAAREAADVGGFEAGTDVRERREKVGKLTTGVPSIDDLMGGGIETQTISEFYGAFGVGKSQVTHQLAVNVQLPPEEGGLGGSCVFIDSEDTFRPTRVEEMVRGLKDDTIDAFLEHEGIEGDHTDEDALEELVTVVLDGIDVAKAFNSDHQILLTENVQDVAEERKDTDKPVRLIAIDSLTAHFRAEYVGRGELADRQQKLNKHLHDILRVARLYNSAAVVTNQVSANPDSYFGDPTQPIGGNILGHTSNFRVYLRDSKGDKRVYKLVDAPNLADGEAVFRVTNNGIEPE